MLLVPQQSLEMKKKEQGGRGKAVQDAKRRSAAPKCWQDPVVWGKLQPRVEFQMLLVVRTKKWSCFSLQPPLRSQNQLNPCTGDLQLSGPTASFGGQELLCSAGLSSAGKGKRFGGLVQRGEDEKRVLLMLEGSWSAGRGSTCGKIHQATSQRHTNSTPNKACLKKTHPPSRCTSQEPAEHAQLGGRARIRRLKHAFSRVWRHESSSLSSTLIISKDFKSCQPGSR